MKSRLAILGMLVAGMLFSTAGAGLALQGQSGTNAAISQYGHADADRDPGLHAHPDWPATPTTGGGSVTPSDICGEGGVLPAEEENAPTTGGRGPAARGDRRPARRRHAARRGDVPGRAPAGGRGPDERAAVHRLRGDPRPARRPRAARAAAWSCAAGRARVRRQPLRPTPLIELKAAALRAIIATESGPPRDVTPAGLASSRRRGRAPAHGRSGSSGFRRSASRGVRAADRGPRRRRRSPGRRRTASCPGRAQRAASIARRASVELAEPRVAVAEHHPRLRPRAEALGGGQRGVDRRVAVAPRERVDGAVQRRPASRRTARA